MDIPIVLAEKVAASAAIGLLIGLEREWAHKDAGVRSFAIAALLGTLSWLVSPTLAFVQMSVVLLVIVLVNVFNLFKDEPLEITTSLALAATNVMGILIGGGSFFLAFTCAIVIAALLSWKSELISFTSKLTIPENSWHATDDLHYCRRLSALTGRLYRPLEDHRSSFDLADGDYRLRVEFRQLYPVATTRHERDALQCYPRRTGQ